MCVSCPPYIETIRQLIRTSEARGEAQEQADRDAGKTLFNGPLGRVLAFSPLSAPRVHVEGALLEETILAHDGSSSAWMRLIVGETRFFDSRRQWGAFVEAKRLLEAHIPAEQVREAIFGLFNHSYGAMGICRRIEPDGTPYVLMGIRGKRIATKNVGQASFPAGMAKPNESVLNTLLREFAEETGVGLGQVMIHPGFAVSYFPDCNSMTFTALLETRTRQPITACTEVKGNTYTWVPESAVRDAVIDGSTEALVGAFRRNDIDAPDGLSVTNDGAASYRILTKVHPL